MTWKQFKEAVEAAGVADAMEIWYINVAGTKAYELEIGLPGKDEDADESDPLRGLHIDG